MNSRGVGTDTRVGKKCFVARFSPITASYWLHFQSRNTTGYPAGVTPKGWLEREAACEVTGGESMVVPSVLLVAAVTAATVWS